MTEETASEDQPTREGSPRSVLVRSVPAALGLVLGVSVISSSPQRGSGTWYVLSALALTLTVSAGAVFSHGLSTWQRLPRAGRSWNIVAVVGSVAAVTFVTTVTYAVATSTAWRGPAVILAALIGGAPSTAVMSGVRRLAKDTTTHSVLGERVVHLIELRSTTRRLLAPLGSLVALAVAELAAKSQLHAQPSAPTVPAGEILVFGALGTLLIVLFYVPAIAEINRQGTQMCDEFLDLRTVADHQAILDLADQRTRLADLLGLNRDTLQDLQTGLIVLGPLIAGASAILLKP